MILLCPICAQPKRSLDGHHIYPIGYGGPFNGPIFNLCASCHQDIHRQAEAFIRGESSLQMPQDNFIRAESDENKKLITSIVKASHNYSQGIIPAGGSLKNHEVIFTLTREKLNDLHRVKVAVGANSLQSLMESAVDTLILKTLGYKSGGGLSVDGPRVIKSRKPKPLR